MRHPISKPTIAAVNGFAPLAVQPSKRVALGTRAFGEKRRPQWQAR